MKARANVWTTITTIAATEFCSEHWVIDLHRKVPGEPEEIVDSGTTYAGRSSAEALSAAMLLGAKNAEDEYMRWQRAVDPVDEGDNLGPSEDF